MDCKHCNSIFKNKYSLEKHLKTAKYCLKLRGIDNSIFKCCDCNKSFTRKHHLIDHKKICKKRDINIQLKDINRQLERKR